MSKFAGSAIAQGPYVGRIDRWSKWRPTSAEPLWLLLSGATDPPKDIGISKRRTRDAPGDKSGAFLAGVTRDLVNMEDVVGAKLFNTVKDLYFTKSAALGHIRRFFDACKGKKAHPMLYYTGHGQIGTGNWCFADGTISIQEIFDMVPGGCHYPMIFSDACYSGHWANFCLEKDIAGFHCLAACPFYSTAVDTKGQGGDLTLFMTGKKPRPSTEPMYSGGNVFDFPITSGFDSVTYVEFIMSHVSYSNRILISQSMHNGRFSGCFATSKIFTPRPDSLIWIQENYDTFIGFVQEKWKFVNGKSKQIYSLACDEKLGFGMFFIENFGTRQVIVRNVSDIDQYLDDGFRITACTARGSTFYIVMTKDTKEYKRKQQRWFTRTTWNGGASKEVTKGYHDGYIMTGICYSSGLEQYFVVMTDHGHTDQSCLWIQTLKVGIDAMGKKYQEGFHPTIIFKDPNFEQTLVMVTKDENRSDPYLCQFNYIVK